MSDVITKPGLYRQQNGRPADVKWVGDGKALGFDSNGEETAWWTATGKWTVEAPDDFGFHITGPWIPDPPEPVEPHAQICELKPIPKPAVDPVWRELGPDEPIVASDQFAFRDNTSNVHEDSYFVDSFDSMVGQTVRQLNQQYPGFAGRIVRRRVAPVAQSEWVPTNELRLWKCGYRDIGRFFTAISENESGYAHFVRKWTNGTDSEWRPVKVDG